MLPLFLDPWFSHKDSSALMFQSHICVHVHTFMNSKSDPLTFSKFTFTEEGSLNRVVVILQYPQHHVEDI